MDARLPDYLQRILTARVYDVATETPLGRAAKLSARLGNDVWLKREDTQPVLSFELCGAYNKMSRLPPEQLAGGVFCASAGNHAQGVALSARRLGCRAVVGMPVTTPRLKSDAARALGGDVVLHGDRYTDAYHHAVELGARANLTLVHPFDDPDVIAGQGTIGMEILRQHQGPLHAVFVAVGGGGLSVGATDETPPRRGQGGYLRRTHFRRQPGERSCARTALTSHAPRQSRRGGASSE